MPKSFIDTILDSIFDEKWVGKRGEKLTERELKLVTLFGRKGRTLRNVYVPKDNGETSEIDLLFITQKGIFVFESKNYTGWIFGNEDHQYWTVTLPNGQKNQFYNPIKQNKTHIKWLQNYIKIKVPLFSIIVFSERCELKNIELRSSDVRVIKRDKTYSVVRELWETSPNTLSDSEIERLYRELSALTDVGNDVKASHIRNIQQKYDCHSKEALDTECPRPGTAAEPAEPEESSVQANAGSAGAKTPAREMTCPRCGKPLILRTAKNGPNAGKQFYGCTGYPVCRFTCNRQP